ncbi:MAG: peptidoglycan recognition family protein [Phycisphaerales bacterium]
MDRLTGVRLVTVHHDGMSPWYASAENDTGARIDAIRRSHQQSNGWGDIGYHFVVDRAGRIWEGRPLVYQGAHVKYHNPGNIGVLCLGNFDRQDPTERQVAALERHLQALMNHYRVPVKLVHTHQELRPTACPGRSLQGAVNSMRWSGRLA